LLRAIKSFNGFDFGFGFFFGFGQMVLGIVGFEMLLVTLKGRMPEGVVCVCYEG
jgi:hypothetical protein